MDWRQDLFYDLRYLWLLVALCGFAYAGFLYYRVLRTAMSRPRGLVTSTDLRSSRPTRQMLPAGTGSGTTTGEPRQEDLLEDLDERRQAPTEAQRQTKPATRRLGEHGPSSTHYPIDAVTTTKVNPQLDPAQRSTSVIKTPEELQRERREGTNSIQDAIRAAVEEAERDEAERDEADTEDGEPTVATAEVAPPTPPPKPSDMPRNRHTTQTELIRKARRHEELGLHIGITRDSRAPAPPQADVSQKDKEQRLRELGLLPGTPHERKDEPAAQASAQPTTQPPPERMGTTELDDILQRLDEALAVTDDEDELEDAPVPENEPTPVSTATSNPLTSTAHKGTPTPPRASEEPVTDVTMRPVTRDYSVGADELDALTKTNPVLQPRDHDVGAAGDDGDEAAPHDTPPAAPAPAPKSESIPAWARADTFDEDGDGDDDKPAEQEKLF